MELRPRDRVVQLKVVYYGPAVCGKTTNLQMLHAAALARHRGELITVNSQQERTILFDLLPLRGIGFHGFDIRFQLMAVPGQAPYAATRRLVMRGTDAVVFVANSAADRLDENVASFAEMNENLKANGLDAQALPIVFQYNKRDLPQVLSVEELRRALNARRAPELEAVATRGDGVLETLGTMMAGLMAELTTRYRSLALGPDETVQTWAWGAIQQVFGRSTLEGAGRPRGATRRTCAGCRWRRRRSRGAPRARSWARRSWAPTSRRRCRSPTPSTRCARSATSRGAASES